MRRCAGLKWGALITLCLWCPDGRAVEADMELVWRSGEKITGQVTGAGDGTILFQPEVAAAAGLFPEAAEIRLSRVEELRLTGETIEARKEAFWIRLRDGGRLLADVEGLREGWLKVSSALLGGTEVRLGDVASIERARGDGVLFFGTGPETAWSESPKVEEPAKNWNEDPFAPADNAPPRVRRVNRSQKSRAAEAGGVLRLWRQAPDGGLRTVSWSGTLTAPLPEAVVKELPDGLRVELRLRAESSPRFVFRLLTATGEARVETWEDRLVLREGSRFQVAEQPLAADAHELRLTLLWNAATRETRLLSGTGRELAVLAACEPDGAPVETAQAGSPQRGEVTAEVPGGVGVSLENLGVDLTLEALNVARWNGELPDAEPVAGAFARLIDGRVVKGMWTGMEDGKAVFQNQQDGRRELVALADLARVRPVPVQAGAENKPLAEEMTAEVLSRHGEWLRGGFDGLRGGSLPDDREQWRLRLRHESFRGGCEPFLTHLGSVLWQGGEAEEASGEAAVYPERLNAGGQSVRGRAVAAGAELPLWLFDGALNPVALNPLQVVMIERDPRAIPAGQADLAEGLTLLCLKGGDMLPARLKALSREGLAFAAAGVLPVTMPAAQVRGVLIPGPPIETEGFSDPGWRQLRGEQVILPAGERSEVVLQPGHALGHPSMMEGDGLDFVLKEETESGMSSLRLTLYASQLQGRPDSLRVLVAFVGDEIYCGDEMENGQMRHQGQLMRTGSAAAVQIRAQGERLLVRVNGSEVVNLQLTAEMRTGAGLILEPGALWGNTAQPVRVSAFQARKSPHRGRVPVVEEEARSQVLTIPRTRESEPPRHVLIAPTGDLLRGTVESWNETAMNLRWGMEQWSVPRERVAAIVLLDPLAVEDSDKPKETIPTAQRPLAAATAPHWLLLANGGRIGLTLSRWAEDGVVGRHPHLGRVVVPVDAVRSLWVRQAPPESEAVRTMTGWQPRLAQAPQIEESAGSALAQVGKEAAAFTLPLLDGKNFVLEEQHGKVVVLDFWASWCAPCLKALPELMAALQGLPSEQVLLLGVNQGEPASHVDSFLTTRRWNLTTVLDSSQSVGRQYGVQGIPHTVVIDQEGKIALVRTGYSPEAAGEIAAKVRELLQIK